MSKIRFKGLVHRKAKDNNYNGFYFNEKEMEEQAKTMAGTDLTDGHLDGVVIGKITGARVTPNKELEVEGYVSRETARGCKVINKMREGRTNGLSLGLSHFVDQDLNVVGKRVDHVSTVKNPDCCTYIYEIEPDPASFEEARKVVWTCDELYKLNNELYKLGKKCYVNRDCLEEKQRSAMSEQQASRGTKRSNPEGEEQQDETARPSKTSRVEGEPLTEAEELEMLRKANEQLTKEVEEKREKLAVLSNLGKTPEQLKEELERKREKSLKKIETDQKSATDYAAQVLTHGGRKTEGHYMIEVLNRAKDNPHYGAQVVEFVTVAKNFMDNSLSTKEKELMAAKKELEEMKSKYSTLETKQKESAKKSEYYSMVGRGNPQKEEERAPPQRTQSDRSSGYRDDSKYNVSRPDITQIYHEGSGQITIRRPPVGRGFRDQEDSRTIWDAFARAPKSAGQEKITYVQRNPERNYRPKDAIPLPDIKGGHFFELPFR